MRIILLIVVLILLLGGLGGLLYVGLFPPHPHVHSVDHTLPNDQFPTH